MKVDGFMRDILAGPERLAALLDAYSGAAPPLVRIPSDVRRIVFIGMGSSRFAALPVGALLRSRGIDAVAELASARLGVPPSPGTLAVGISATGRSEETIEALARHHGVSTTVAVTNDPSSPITESADVVLPLHAGVEEGGVACLTYQATLALLHLLAARLSGDHQLGIAQLEPALGASSALRDGRDDWLEELSNLVATAHTTYTIAPAERYSSALQSALMLREGPRLAADGTETGDWLHVDVYLSKRPGYTALLFPGSRYDAGVIGYARDRGSTIVAVGREVEGATLTVPFPRASEHHVALLVETGVSELVAAELWRRGIASGDEALC